MFQYNNNDSPTLSEFNSDINSDSDSNYNNELHNLPKGSMYLKYEILFSEGDLQIDTNNKLQGSGKIYLINNNTFEGTFVNGFLQGPGKMEFYKSKRTFEGTFSKGQLNGRATVIDSDRYLRYEGIFHNGVRLRIENLTEIDHDPDSDDIDYENMPDLFIDNA